MKRLYISDDGIHFEELSALAHSASFKPIKRIKIEKAFESYIKNCTTNKCLKNQNSEKLHFKRLEKFLKDKEIVFIDEVSCIIMQEYESFMLKQMKVSSVNRRFNTFKHFFVMCKSWEYINESPCLGMKKRREENNPYAVWPEPVFDKFIKKTSGIYTKIFKFLWATGCRPIEVKNLKWTDISFDTLEIKLKCGKNAKVSRNFPLTKELDQLIHSIKMESIYVFSENKKQISNDLLYHYCKTRFKELGETKYTVYGLRHTFGSRLSQQGANAFDIAELMGHSKMETTRRYIHTNKKDLLKLLAKNK